MADLGDIKNLRGSLIFYINFGSLVSTIVHRGLSTDRYYSEEVTHLALIGPEVPTFSASRFTCIFNSKLGSIPASSLVVHKCA